MNKVKVLDTAKKEIKNNKYTVIVILIFTLLIILGFILYKALVPDSSSDVKYGNRLDGIEEVKPSNSDLDKLDKEVEKLEYVTSSKSSISGRIIKSIIVVKDGTTNEQANEISSLILSQFDEDQVAYFDFEVFFTNENEEAEGFPIIGYKNRSNELFSYSSSK